MEAVETTCLLTLSFETELNEDGVFAISEKYINPGARGCHPTLGELLQESRAFCTLGSNVQVSS